MNHLHMFIVDLEKILELVVVLIILLCTLEFEIGINGSIVI